MAEDVVEVEYRWHDRTPQHRQGAPESSTLGRVVRVRGPVDAMLHGLSWPVGCMLYTDGEPLMQWSTLGKQEGR